jgi:hypothetical protein
MPSLEELFRQKKNTSGPNTGKTAEEIYAPQDSKRIIPITSTNYAINKLSNATISGKPAGGLVGDILSGFDVLRNMNKLRNTRSIKLSETLNEQEEVGLKQFQSFARPVLYGLDFPRITNQNTQTLLTMKRAVDEGAAGGLDDVIGQAVGNYAGDAMANFLNNGKKATLPPKPDLTPIALNAISDVGSRLLGSILPGPMIPSKVAEEFGKGYDAGKFEYIRESNTRLKILDLKNKDKVPGFITNLLKPNKNILAQSKDFLISTATSVVSNLFKAGATALVRKSVAAVTGKQLSYLILGPESSKNRYSSVPEQARRWWSKNTYERTVINSINPNYLADQKDLEAFFRRNALNELVAAGLAIVDPDTNLVDFPNYGTITMDMALQLIVSDPIYYSNVHNTTLKDTIFLRKGISTIGDFLNLSADMMHPGTHAKDVDGKTYDEWDFVALKFYSEYKQKTLQFRCTITDLQETFTPSWEPNKFIGNPFNSYTYGGVERSVSFKFKVFSLNLTEHKNAWRRLNALAAMTYPQGYKGIVNAAAPPIIAVTLGSMYEKRNCFIESMTFSVDENSPWEVGMNGQLLNGQIGANDWENNGGMIGYRYDFDPNVSPQNWILPMIVDVDITLKFIESKSTVYSETAENGNILYDYANPTVTSTP